MGNLEIIPLEALELMIEDSLQVEGRFEIERHHAAEYWKDDPVPSYDQMESRLKELISKPVASSNESAVFRLTAEQKLKQFAADHNCLYRVHVETGNIVFYRI